MKSTTQLIGLTMTLCALASTAQAEQIKDAIGPGDSDNRWILGGNVVTYNNLYKGEGSDAVLYPAFEYNGDRFFVKNGSINFSIGQHEKMTYGLTASPSATFLSFDEDYRDNNQLAGLQEREATVEAGFYVNHTTDTGRFSFSVLTDLGSEHDGQRATASYTYDLQAGNWRINPTIGAQWMSSDIVNHQYGVSAAESTATRAAFEAGGALNLFAGVRARYDITEHWEFGASTGFTILSDNITDSSIVEEDYGYHGSLSMSYKF